MTSKEECSICLETIKLQLTLPCSHKFCYLCLKEARIKNLDRCPLCRAEIPDDTFETAVVAEEPDGIEWLYSGRNGGWWAYEPELSAEIEAAFADQATGHEFTLLGSKYVIDFTEMTQTQVQTSATRKVKRCQDSDRSLLKGIAGLKLATKIDR